MFTHSTLVTHTHTHALALTLTLTRTLTLTLTFSLSLSHSHSHTHSHTHTLTQLPALREEVDQYHQTRRAAATQIQVRIVINEWDTGQDCDK